MIVPAESRLSKVWCPLKDLCADIGHLKQTGGGSIKSQIMLASLSPRNTTQINLRSHDAIFTLVVPHLNANGERQSFEKLIKFFDCLQCHSKIQSLSTLQHSREVRVFDSQVSSISRQGYSKDYNRN